MSERGQRVRRKGAAQTMEKKKKKNLPHLGAFGGGDEPAEAAKGKTSKGSAVDIPTRH